MSCSAEAAKTAGDWMPAVCVMAASFLGGVSFAMYRAIGWADRMKAWAQTVPCPEPEEEVICEP